jgi:hypothetical protein
VCDVPSPAALSAAEEEASEEEPREELEATDRRVVSRGVRLPLTPPGFAMSAPAVVPAAVPIAATPAPADGGGLVELGGGLVELGGGLVELGGGLVELGGLERAVLVAAQSEGGRVAGGSNAA